MSIIPASRLSSSDLALLGNNVMPARRSKRQHQFGEQPHDAHQLAAVQRSLASVGESVTELYSAAPSAGGQREC